ncbi:MAG: hypothetical protein KDC35_18685 [Acidobacteria bacterium]|nr:hypothetical protein [Acidobacteriota bacterium]
MVSTRGHVSRFVRDAIGGGVIFSLGDSIACWIIDAFQWQRLLTVLAMGSLLYAWEVPRYFGWIDRIQPHKRDVKAAIKRTLLAVVYFNPLWIARHLVLLKLGMAAFQEISWSLLVVASYSFLAQLPVTAVVNFVIQNHVPTALRFPSSATFSTLMAVYYALIERFFG